MRKIKTKGLKIKVKPIDRGPRFAIALHTVNNRVKTKELLTNVFDCNESLADVVINAAPLVICQDLDRDVAEDYVRKLKSAGDFRVWLESAASKMKKMNLKQKAGPEPLPAPEIRKH